LDHPPNLYIFAHCAPAFSSPARSHIIPQQRLQSSPFFSAPVQCPTVGTQGHTGQAQAGGRVLTSTRHTAGGRGDRLSFAPLGPRAARVRPPSPMLRPFQPRPNHGSERQVRRGPDLRGPTRRRWQLASASVTLCPLLGRPDYYALDERLFRVAPVPVLALGAPPPPVERSQDRGSRRAREGARPGVAR